MFEWIKKLFRSKTKDEEGFIEASNGIKVETDNSVLAEVAATAFKTGKIVTYSGGKMTVHDDER